MTDRPRSTTDDDTTGLSPEESLALIGAQRRATQRALEIDDRLLYGAWGIAWVVAYGITYLVYGADPSDPSGPVWLAGVVWPVAIGAALLVTFLHVHRRRAGVAEQVSGTLYGLAYMIAIAGAGLTGGVLPRLLPTVDPAFASIAPSAFIVLAIATIYLVSGAVWGDRLQFGVGAWLVLVNALSLMSGTDTYTLGMAVGGGGGFLVAALLAWLRDRTAEAPPAR